MNTRVRIWKCTERQTNVYLLLYYFWKNENDVDYVEQAAAVVVAAKPQIVIEWAIHW